MPLAIVGTVHQAISGLQMTSEPEFLRFDYRNFVTFETIRIAWHGLWIVLGGESLGENLFGFARLLLFIAFGHAIVAC